MAGSPAGNRGGGSLDDSGGNRGGGSPAGNGGGVAVVGSPDDSGRGVVALSWILFGVRGLKDSGTVAAVLSMIQAGTVAAVLSMIQAVNGCGGAVVVGSLLLDSVGGPKANYSLHNPPPAGVYPHGV